MAGAGKDFTFKYLHGRYHHRHQIKRASFADGVRYEIEAIVGAGNEELPAIWNKPYPPEIRALLQWWGTELRRDQNPDYWVNYAFDELAKWSETVKEVNRKYNAELLYEPYAWVFTDVRFANEAEGIRSRGGIIIEVQAAQGVRARRLGGVLPPNHASEEIDFAPDGYIENENDHGDPSIPKVLLDYLG